MAQTLDSLTPREQEALLLLAQGFSPAQIAAMLNITPGSLHNLLAAIRQKLQVATSIQAVVWAWAHGLLDAAPPGSPAL